MNGFNLSFGFKSYYNQFNRNIGKQFSTIASNSTEVNSINVDYTDMTNQVYFQSLFVQKFLIGGGVELKFLKIKSGTLANVDPVIDKSSYLSLFGYLRFDSFDNKYFPKKGWYFTGDIQSGYLANPITLSGTNMPATADALKVMFGDKEGKIIEEGTSACIIKSHFFNLSKACFSKSVNPE